MIVADTREKIDHGFENEEELPAGDYCIEGTDKHGNERKILVERKEWAELAGAVMSGQIFSQLGRMLEQDHEVYLVVEGVRNDAFRHAGARRGQLRRFISSAMVKMDVKVYIADSTNDAINFVQDIDDWINDHRDRTHSVRETKKVPGDVRPQYILEGLPKVGPGRAQDLLEEFGSAHAVLTASEEELKEVDGIGTKTAESIVEAVRREVD